MLTIYGNRQSRTGRCLWALEELGLPYSLEVVIPSQGETRTDKHLKLNTMGKVPVLVDGDFVLTESLAINTYLAALAASPRLWPTDARSQGRIHQWSSWASTELEFPLTMIVREVRRAAAAGTSPDAGLMAACLQTCESTLAALESHFKKGNAFVAGDSFTLGDVNTAFSVNFVASRIAMDAFPATKAWLEGCLARSAWQRVLAIDEEKLRASVAIPAPASV